MNLFSFYVKCSIQFCFLLKLWTRLAFFQYLTGKLAAMAIFVFYQLIFLGKNKICGNFVISLCLITIAVVKIYDTLHMHAWIVVPFEKKKENLIWLLAYQATMFIVLLIYY